MEKIAEPCPICLDEIIEKNFIISGCCNKIFHNFCYNECMKLKLECPMCRSVQGISTNDNLIPLQEQTFYRRNSYTVNIILSFTLSGILYYFLWYLNKRR